MIDNSRPKIQCRLDKGFTIDDSGFLISEVPKVRISEIVKRHS